MTAVVILQASLDEETYDHEPGPLPADLGLDFSPGPSTAAGPGPDTEGTNMVQKKRNITEAEAQPILPDMGDSLPLQVSCLTCAPQACAACFASFCRLWE